MAQRLGARSLRGCATGALGISGTVEIEASGGTAMASPGWLIYSLYGFDKKMDWTLCAKVGKSIFNTVRTWLHTCKIDKELCDEFDSSLKKEIQIEFEKTYVEKIYEITKPENQ